VLCCVYIAPGGIWHGIALSRGVMMMMAVAGVCAVVVVRSGITLPSIPPWRDFSQLRVNARTENKLASQTNTQTSTNQTVIQRQRLFSRSGDLATLEEAVLFSRRLGMTCDGRIGRKGGRKEGRKEISAVS